MLALWLLLSCKEVAPITTATAAAAVQTAPAVAAEWLPTVEISGSVEPVAMVQLGFDVPGRIEVLLVQRGQLVRKGDALARLDSRMASAQAAQAQAAVDGARAQIAAAELTWQRLEKLKIAGAVSEQQYTDAQGQIEAARAGLMQAEAALRLTRTHVGMHTLRSPIDGVISNAPDNAGSLVGAGTPIFLIEDLTSYQLKASIGTESGWVAAGQKASVQVGGPGEDRRVEAEVSRVLPSLDMATRRIPVELRIPATEGVRAHGYVRAVITGSAPVPVLSVPTRAVAARPDFSVFTVQPGAGAEAAIRVPVEVVGEEGENSLIRGALSAGTLVIIEPAFSLGAE